METGTGKTLVYLKTIYALYQSYSFTKFIILVPSVAIRQGVISSFNAFKHQLADKYGFTPKLFEYDSKSLPNLTHFIEEQHPQIMVMTLASFNSDDKILNQHGRDDMFSSADTFLGALAKTRPIIMLDEPQVGMGTENAEAQIAKLNPLFKVRYSATHAVIKNLIYRLTPFDSYQQGLVKKIEVLTVTEKNDEATFKMQLTEAANDKNELKVKIMAWHQAKSTSKIEYKNTSWLKKGDKLADKTNNPSYLDFTIERIQKSLRTGQWSITFTNGAALIEKQSTANLQNIWAVQLEWLMRRHFSKQKALSALGIKCLSLIFIDKVANYMSQSADEPPIIKNLFIAKYQEIFAEFNKGEKPNAQHIQAIQGYYFAQKANAEYSDTEGGVKEQSKIYKLILEGREELLSLDNPVQFIFSHSALGVGWDNPNVFNIATLNSTVSETKKRQEIGRGLRICVNQDGWRVYDAPDVADHARINQLTVIPNESYESFVEQYQAEIKAVYGSDAAGADFTHSDKGAAPATIQFKRNPNVQINAAFKQFWQAMAKKTDYVIAFDESDLISKAVARMNEIKIEDMVIEATSHTLQAAQNQAFYGDFGGTDSVTKKGVFNALDLLEELSENTGLSYRTLFSVFSQLSNHSQLVKNPPKFIHLAANILREVEMDEMLRGLTYSTNGEVFNFNDTDYERSINPAKVLNTPHKGIFNKIVFDSGIEKTFAKALDDDTDNVVCFIKLPDYYSIKIPKGNGIVGDYHPDFGVVMKRKNLKDGAESSFYFVIETKGTNNIDDKTALTPAEVFKIKCAMKHFASIGVDVRMDVRYEAPIKEYSVFKRKFEQRANL